MSFSYRSNEPLPSNYIDYLQEFVNREQDTQNNGQLEIWNKPLELRVAEAMAIEGLRIVEYNEKHATLQFTQNRSKFREGDPVRLNRGDPQRGFISCELEEELEDNLIRIKAGYQKFFTRLEPRDGWVLDMDLPDLRQIQLSALEEIKRSDEERQYFYRLLTGSVAPVFRSTFASEERPVPPALATNIRQSEAYTRACQAQNYYLIQGPPGTGKTRVLAHLAETFAREGKNVLITAFRHRAINNALKAVAKNTSFPNVIKVGQQIHANDLAYEGGEVPSREYFSDYSFDSKIRGLVVGGTCYALRSRRLQNIEFDVVIFDEAGQMPLPLAMIGMKRAEKAIFIGDHKQMPPVITSKHDQAWVSKSIFETLWQHTEGTTLDVTYRMNDRIAEFPSQRFYGGVLHPDETTKHRRLNLSPASEPWTRVLAPENPDVFIQVDHQNRTLDSIEEAQIVAGILAEAIRCGLNPKDVAVVAPYRAQGRLIKNELRKVLSKTVTSQIVVDTVERIQGQEREVIIISLTTSDPVHAAQNAEFYFQPNRLNVAITRPKTKRIIIGSTHLLAAIPKADEHRKWVRNFIDLYEQSYVIPFRY